VNVISVEDEWRMNSQAAEIGEESGKQKSITRVQWGLKSKTRPGLDSNDEDLQFLL
jgi:hypothetical protein